MSAEMMPVLPVFEARAILAVDAMLEATFEVREARGLLLDTIDLREAWVRLVAIARDRIDLYDGHASK